MDERGFRPWNSLYVSVASYVTQMASQQANKTYGQVSGVDLDWLYYGWSTYHRWISAPSPAQD